MTTDRISTLQSYYDITTKNEADDMISRIGLDEAKNFLDPKTSKQGKLDVCSKALHPEFTYPLITVSECSIEKNYEPLNWLKKENKVTALSLIGAAQRHLDKVKMGIDINTEETKPEGTPTTNQPYHAAQAAYNLLMLVKQIEKGVIIDDRLFKDGELK